MPFAAASLWGCAVVATSLNPRSRDANNMVASLGRVAEKARIKTQDAVFGKVGDQTSFIPV